MKKTFLSLIVLMAAAVQLQAIDYTKYVNPFIGTQTDETGALSGSTFPGPTMPQGMVQLAPETEQYVTWDPCCGYDFNKDSIFGFTHTHLSGTGCTDLIDISLMPSVRKVSPAELKKGIFAQTYKHAEESATPGFYMVKLQNEDILVNLSATVHAGIHKYTFPKSAAQQTVILDLDRMTWRGDAYYAGRRAYQIIQSQMRVVDDHTIEGFRVLTGWAKLRKVYFRAEFSKPFTDRLLMDGGRSVGKSDVMNGRALRAALEFSNQDSRDLMVKVAISAVDNNGARKNMKAEAQSWDFNYYVKAAHDAWEKELARIDIEGTDAQKTIFYTGLYHVLMQPNTMSDVDGRYMDTNFEIKQMPQGQAYHSTFSLWDTFRAAHPLYTLLCPDVAAQFVRDMILHHQTYGYLPIWDLWGQDNYCMIGNHAIPVLADAILAEIPGVDAEAAYKAMYESSTRTHTNSPFEVWEQYGYMPQDLQGTSVSITLEQAFDDWCVAAVAKKLGKQADYERFLKRSEFYRNLWDPSIGFFRPRDSKGNFIEKFDPLSYEEPCFIEGNAWQYMWFVPQNPKGLIELLGGEKNFIKKLDENFTLTATSGEVNGNASGFVGQYAHGNEPSHHTAYLYNFAGQPWRGSAEYTIGTPLFQKATLHLAGGKDFTILAPRKSDKAIYVKGVKLNGQKVTDWTLTHQQLMAGGTLQFQMSEKK